MANTVLPWAQYTEAVVGLNHPTLADVDNRALRSMLARSSFQVDSVFRGLPVGSSIINAGSSDYTGTAGARVTAAIVDAVAAGIPFVFVPKFAWDGLAMLPYSGATFNTGVQMLREIGYPRYIDLQAYGADASGSGTLCDSALTGCINRAIFLSSRNLGASMPSTGASIYAAQGTYYTSATMDFTGIPICEFIGDGPRLTRFVTSVTTTAGINACNATTTSFTVLRGFTLYQSGLAIPGAARAGNYGIRNTAGVGFQLIIDEVEVNYFANSGLFIEGPTGPTVISNCSVQFNAGWGLEITPFGGNGGENIQMLAGNIHQCWGGITVNKAAGNQFHAVDIELGNTGLWPCIYLTGGAAGNSFYECTVSAQPLQALVNPSNGIVVVDNGIANTFINGINIAGANQGTDNYRLVGSSERTTVVGGQHQNSSVTGGFFAVIQSINNSFIDPGVITATYQAGKNTVSEGSGVGNNTVIIGTGTNGPIGTAGVGIGSSSITVGQRISSGKSTLTDAATVALDASLANTYILTATGAVGATRAIGLPTNPVNGQRILVTFIQDGTGGRALTWNAVFKNTWSDAGNTASKRSSMAHVYDGTNWNQDGAQTAYV